MNKKNIYNYIGGKLYKYYSYLESAAKDLHRQMVLPFADGVPDRAALVLRRPALCDVEALV